jgi:hypothetical protein
LYIGPEIKGNAAANADRKKEFPAIADAAYGLYATTRKVKTEVKTYTVPVPNLNKVVNIRSGLGT